LACILFAVANFSIARGVQNDSQPLPTRPEITKALHGATSFFRDHASAHGGYVFQISADLSKREGEGSVTATTAWIEPPGTPAVGLAFLQAYRLCKDPILLEAARETAEALRQGQLESGGWDNRIEFDTKERSKYAYRTETKATRKDKLRNTTTFDDNKSQSAIRFLMEIDVEVSYADQPVHEAVLYALNSVLKSQYPNGAWPQRFSEFPDPDLYPVMKASIPEQWSKKYPGKKYSEFYTLNDNTICDLIDLLLDAADIYQRSDYRDAACRGGDFLILAQLPEPQPGWSQQYDKNMHPAWARKFEPPAITGGESQRVMRTLMRLYRRNMEHIENAERFLEPLNTAIPFYQRSELANGKLARFYELRTNRPLFFTKEYQLTYSSEDMPTHYAFMVSSKLNSIEREFRTSRSLLKPELPQSKPNTQPKRTKALDTKVMTILKNLDTRGAWVETGRLRYHGPNDTTTQVIRSDTFANNLISLATWLGAE
jgi:PelA/Pel-15E family pectate lyase